MHGTGSRFLSIQQLKGDELMPRIIPIAGVYPGITAQEFMAPASTPSPSYGRWAYDFSDPEGPQVGTVAYPASALVHACADPVVLIASNDALGIDLAGDHDIEAMVLVDRGDRFFQATKFYAFAAPDGSVVIRWFDQIPEGWALLGKVHYITLPWTEKTGKYKSGWMEVEDDD
jgi:hypothetical protein